MVDCKGKVDNDHFLLQFNTFPLSNSVIIKKQITNILFNRPKSSLFKIKKSMRAVFFLGGCGAYFEGKTLFSKRGSFLDRSV